MTAVMFDLERKIEATEAKLQKAEDEGRMDLILMYGNILAKQQETLNLLLAQSVPTPGKSPSNKF
ncbi:hypothetical protein EON65_41060 [archaeon]|nr:MAG: hypothetical protein EON65_41060 [archaeon]